MDNVEYNRRWNFDFSKNEENWSKPWGSSYSQWWSTIYSRIHSFLPTDTILEIAPGHGRWTQYLEGLCRNLIIIDLNEKCIEGCKKGFGDNSKITYYVNDGKSLEMLEEHSIDFVFSFDSLVHADEVVLKSYLEQLAYKLKPNGVGFFHHSNRGEYHNYYQLTEILPVRGRKFLESKRLIDFAHGRNGQMTAKLFEELCRESGLQCISQELINWSGKFLIDCLS